MTSCLKIVTSLPLFQFLANLELSGSLLQDAWSVKHILINNDLLSYKNWKQTLKISNPSLTLLVWVKVLFMRKNTSAKLRGPWYKKIYFLKLNMCVYLRAKLWVSSIIVTSFRKGLILPLSPPQNEPLKSPPRLGLINKGNGETNNSCAA